MIVEKTRLEGLLVLTPPRQFRDPRGFFVEAYRQNEWTEAGLPFFVQDNHSRSSKGVLRGLHFNNSGGGQGKLVRAAYGTIWDVAVDLRRSSPTFGQWQGFEISDQDHRQIYVPPGFGHGFCVLSEQADVAYKLTSYFDETMDFGVLWSDPRIGVAWPVLDPLVSNRDASNPTLEEMWSRLPA